MVADFAEDLAQMALELHAEGDLEGTGQRVLEHALKAMDCAYAGIMFLTRRAEVETQAATDPVVAHLDRIQVEVGEGPDMDVISDRFSVLVTDTATDPRWPAWSRQVAAQGIRSFLNVRLYTAKDRIGTLNFYDPAPDRFDVGDQETAHLIARHAAVALAVVQQNEHLWQAVEARKVIGQAQGILMERFDLTEDQAFSVLLRYSQHHNLKLRLVAEHLIATRKLPE